MIERDIEKYFLHEISALGALVWKFTSPGTVGVPDRIVMLNGQAYFVELKRPNEKPRPIQKSRARQIRDRGLRVYCISTKQQVDKFKNSLQYGQIPREEQYDPI